MIKNILKANETATANGKEMEILHKNFPQCFTQNGEFDFEKFRTIVAEKADVVDEGYDLNFLGKNYAKLLASVDTTTVIQPDTENNDKPENSNSQNIYISGDNLDALKHLLKSYANAVKCIYIDPPYNTGSDGFVYNDHFAYTAEQLQNKLSVSPQQAEKIMKMTSRGSASHSAWLTFMAARLALARDLLTPDGVIFISIDDNEQANLKLLCDSIFGEENFITNIVIETANGVFGTRASQVTKTMVKVKDYVLVYTKNKSEIIRDFVPLYMPTNELFDTHFSIMLDSEYNKCRFLDFLKTNEYTQNVFKRYNVNISLDNVSSLMQIDKDFNKYIISISDKIYQDVDFSLSIPNDIDEQLILGKTLKFKNTIIFRTRNGLGEIRQYIALKDSLKNTDSYISEYRRAVAIGDLWEGFDADMKNVSKEGGVEYNNGKKPIRLIKQLVKWANIEDGIVVDFFSGSASTAHAIMQLNIEDGHNRKYICVQIPDNLDDAGNTAEVRSAINFLDSIGKPHTLDQIGMERIRRAAKKIKEENPTFADKIDFGFKHYTLAEPTPDTIDRLETFNPNGTMVLDENILNKFGADTVLQTWLVRDGYGFGASTQEVKLKNYTAHLCGKHLYFINANLSDDDVVALVDKYNGEAAFNPENIVIFGYSFGYSQTEMLRKNLSAVKNGNLKINIDIRY